MVVAIEEDFAPFEQAIQAERVRQYESNKRKHSARERSVLIMASGIAACDWCC
jgi:hypothetical protein